MTAGRYGGATFGSLWGEERKRRRSWHRVAWNRRNSWVWPARDVAGFLAALVDTLYSRFSGDRRSPQQI